MYFPIPRNISVSFPIQVSTKQMEKCSNKFKLNDRRLASERTKKFYLSTFLRRFRLLWDLSIIPYDRFRRKKRDYPVKFTKLPPSVHDKR